MNGSNCRNTLAISKEGRDLIGGEGALAPPNEPLMYRVNMLHY